MVDTDNGSPNPAPSDVLGLASASIAHLGWGQRFLRARLRPRKPGEPAKRGQGLIEFAFCAPLMLLLLLGTLDFGQMFFEYIQMRNAVREGAVYAARYSFDGQAAAEEAARQSGGIGGVLDNADTHLTVEFSSALTFGTQTTVTVTATRTFRPVTLSFFERIGIDEIELSASSSAQVWT